MKIKPLILNLIALAGMASSVQASTPCTDFNKDWNFTLTDSAQYAFANYKAEGWRNINLPHDWSVELDFDSIAGEGCTGYLVGGIAWYNKEFNTPINEDEKCYIVFDGVYNNSEYWINGKKLGEHPYGYSPFYYDLTDYLAPKGQPNQLMVRVDHSRYADSRWYTGSGIYREVELVVANKLHIPVWGTFITTPYVTEERANTNLRIEVQNDFTESQSGLVVTDYYNAEGEQVATASTPFTAEAGELVVVNQTAEIANPSLWGIDTPNLYTAKSAVIANGEKVGEKTTRFGIRSIKFDADKGFFLNGENMKIKGVCLHHDAGIIGSAVLIDVWRDRLESLRQMGCNAIRISHNPAAGAFLSLCDEMGFLVQEEFFDEWDAPKDKRLNMDERSIDYLTRGYAEHFQEWGERDLKNVMKRSRNHPSIIQWSIGNEIEWTYPGNKESTGFFGADAAGGYFWNQPPYSPSRIKEEWSKQPKQTYHIGKTAQKLAAWTREMDTTRPVVANCILPSISYETGYIDALDIAGFSYRRVMYDYAKKNYPDKPVMGTENLGQWHEWKAVLERDFVAGMFVWTGIDYMGEVGGTGRKWPQKTLPSGFLDLAGFEKPSFYMMKSLWNDEPMIAIYSNTAAKSSYKVSGDAVVDKKAGAWEQRLWEWENVNAHWNYAPNTEVIVELYSNCDEIELFLNGKSLGKRYLADFSDHIYKWAVNYTEGTLTAKGKLGKSKVTTSIVTVDDVASIRLTSNRTKMAANEQDVVRIEAQLIDKKGRAISNEERTINFDIAGAHRLLGVDNGDPYSVQRFQATTIKTYKGRALLLLQATDEAAALSVAAQGEGLASNKLQVTIK